MKLLNIAIAVLATAATITPAATAGIRDNHNARIDALNERAIHMRQWCDAIRENATHRTSSATVEVRNGWAFFCRGYGTPYERAEEVKLGVPIGRGTFQLEYQVENGDLVIYTQLGSYTTRTVEAHPIK